MSIINKFIQSVVLLFLSFVVLVSGLARPPPVVTQQTVVQLFSNDITIVGVDLGGTGSNVVILLGSVNKAVCQSSFPDQLSYLVENTTIICRDLLYEMNVIYQTQSQDITITVDGVTHVSKQMLIYKQSTTSCVGGVMGNTCNSEDTCSYGICQCSENTNSSRVGPLCSLDQTDSTYLTSPTQPNFKYTYQSGFLEWNIQFNKLNVWDSASSSFIQLKDLTTEVTWTQTTSGTNTFIYTSSNIDTVSGVGNVKVTMELVGVTGINQTIGDYSTSLNPNSMQLSVEVLNLPKSNTTTYQVGFKIETNYNVPCGIQDMNPNVSYTSHHYNNDASDTRWFLFTKGSASLYGRYPSRCLADNGDIVQTCALTLQADEVEQSLGNGQFFINYPVFNTNSQTWFDLLIINNNTFVSAAQNSSEYDLLCDVHSSSTLKSPSLASWFLPIAIILICITRLKKEDYSQDEKEQ